MTKILHATIFLSVVLLSGCFAPVMQTYDSARMVKKDELEAKVNFSSYSSPSYPDMSLEANGSPLFQNTNYGIAAIYGLNDKTNLGFRYEYINNQNKVLDSLGINSDWITSIIEEVYNVDRIDFYEFSPKFSLKQDKIAFSAPIALYRLASDVPTIMYEFKPRFHFTFANKKNTFDFSIVPQGRFLFNQSSVGALMPSLGLGMGFSSDLDKWAIRPEISYDYWTIGLGVSGSYRFNVGKKNKR